MTNQVERDGLSKGHDSCTLITVVYPAVIRSGAEKKVGTWLSLVERTLGVGEVASSNLVVPTIIFNNFNKLDAPILKLWAKMIFYVASYWTHFLATQIAFLALIEHFSSITAEHFL